MDLVWWEIVVLIAAGFGAGLVNVMAGGGSILTVPIMMFLGMPGPIANGTNRITIVAHNFSAMRHCDRHVINKNDPTPKTSQPEVIYQLEV